MSIASQRKKHEEERKRRQQQATPMPAEQHQVVESAAAPEPISPQFDFASRALEAAFREHDDEEKQREREAAEHIHREQVASHAKHQADDQQQRMDAMRAADAQASQMRRESFAAKDSEQRRPSLSRSDREAPTSRVEPDRGEVGDLRGVHAYSTGTERLGHSASMTDFVPERDKAGAGTEHVNPAAWKDHIKQPAQAAEQGGLVISGEPIKPTQTAAQPQPKAEIQAGSKAAAPAPAQEATSSQSAQRVAERVHADATPAAQPPQMETQDKPVPQAGAGQVAEHVTTAAPIGPQAQADSKAAVPAPAAQEATSNAQRVHAEPTPAAQPQAETQARPVPQAEKAGHVVEHVTTAAPVEPQAQAGSKAAAPAPAQEVTSSLSVQRVVERFHADATPAVQPPQTETQARPAPQAEKAGQVIEHAATVAPTEPQAKAGNKAAVPAPAQEATSSLSAQRVANRFRADDEPAKDLPKTEARKVDLDDEAEHAQDQEGGDGGEGQGNAQQEPAMDGQDQQEPAKQQGPELDDYADDYGL